MSNNKKIILPIFNILLIEGLQKVFSMGFSVRSSLFQNDSFSELLNSSEFENWRILQMCR